MGIRVDWETLTLTCPWRIIIARVLAEELRVQQYRARLQVKIMTACKRMCHAAGGDVELDRLMKLFLKDYAESYVAVRKPRLGWMDGVIDERLEMARLAASERGL
jgi:hypothetical protein